MELKTKVNATKELVVKKGNYEVMNAVSHINYLIKTLTNDNVFGVTFQGLKIVSIKRIKNRVFINYDFTINSKQGVIEGTDVFIWLLDLFGPWIKLQQC